MNEYALSINPRSKWTESSKAAKVSVRELEILILHSEGKSNEEIAETLDIKYQTVKNMLHSLNKKLDATTKKCVFIDDKIRNLIPAHELGIIVLRFESFERFKEQLNDLGIQKINPNLRREIKRKYLNKINSCLHTLNK